MTKTKPEIKRLPEGVLTLDVVREFSEWPTCDVNYYWKDQDKALRKLSLPGAKLALEMLRQQDIREADDRPTFLSSFSTFESDFFYYLADLANKHPEVCEVIMDLGVPLSTIEYHGRSEGRMDIFTANVKKYPALTQWLHLIDERWKEEPHDRGDRQPSWWILINREHTSVFADNVEKCPKLVRSICKGALKGRFKITDLYYHSLENDTKAMKEAVGEPVKPKETKIGEPVSIGDEVVQPIAGLEDVLFTSGVNAAATVQLPDGTTVNLAAGSF